ncbi:MAG: DUF2807 domain-containing protein [Myxococcales bacterium]|nr:DUF2807 domain-containing protein [Myxococcales bacterium]MCB9703120.1 DUF2807 domain-containing protein [Myxococcales bacterium]
MPLPGWPLPRWPLALVAAALACPVVGDGEPASEARTIEEAIDAIEVFDAIAVDVTLDAGAGEATAIEVSADQNLLGLVATELHSESVLSLAMWPTVESRPKTPVHAAVTTRALARVFATHTSVVAIDGVDAPSFELKGRGDATLRASGSASEASVDAGDRATVELVGAFEVLTLRSSGAGHLVVGDAAALDLVVDLGSSEDVRACATGTVSGTLHGAGSLILTCTPGSLDVEVNGEGEVIVEPP